MTDQMAANRECSYCGESVATVNFAAHLTIECDAVADQREHDRAQRPDPTPGLR